MMTYRQGDIVLVWFPDSNLLTAKKRPAIVLQTDNLQTGLPQIIVDMITSNLARKGHPSRIYVDITTKVGQQTNLTSDSIIMTDNLATIRTSEIYRKLGSFVALSDLKTAIKYTFGI